MSYRWMLIALCLSVALLGAPAAQPAKPPAPKEGPLGMKFVSLPKGTFYMGWGYLDRKEVTKTEIKQDFEIAVYPVTQGQWQAVMGNNPSCFSRQGVGRGRVKGISDADLQQFPVENVKWFDTQEFIRKFNEREAGRGYVYRLPTEAEWEYACRGGATSQEECSYHFYFDKPTNVLSSKKANFASHLASRIGSMGNGLGRSTRVGSYQPNKLGLHDMHGNVAQWCEDRYDQKRPDRMIRGGSWRFSADTCTAGHRSYMPPTERRDSEGFRLVRVLFQSN